MTSILLDFPRILIGSAWTRLLALMALAGAVIVAAYIPQGWYADSYLRSSHPGPLKTWAEWGLTELPAQPLFWSLVVLFVGSAVLGAVRLGRSPREDDAPTHQLKAKAARPEDAPETIAAALRPSLGEPDDAEWDGETTTLRYALGPKPGDVVRTAIGLAIIFVASVYVLQPPPESRTVARAWLSAEDLRLGAKGVFDLVEGEEFTFFQSQDVYVLRGYAADRLGQGPALQFQWSEPGGGRFATFWLYENAPRGFDGRHRRADVGLDVLKARLEPLPGAGATARPASWGLIIGVGLLMLGAIARLQPPLSAVVQCRGHDVRVQLRATGGGAERTWRRMRRAVEDTFPVGEAS